MTFHDLDISMRNAIERAKRQLALQKRVAQTEQTEQERTDAAKHAAKHAERGKQ